MNIKPRRYNKLVAVKLTDSQFEIIEEVVNGGKLLTNSASEFIREAIDSYLLQNQGSIGWEKIENYFDNHQG
jgi:Arc/MetJ-type ribon-helix-helix transcriptional regulator